VVSENAKLWARFDQHLQDDMEERFAAARRAA
jgi:hypothetical protein